MINSKLLTYRLEFDRFGLEFELDLERSAHITEEISDSRQVHAFAVVEARFTKGDASGCILSSAEPGNFLEDLKSIASQLESIPRGADLNNLIACGAWCAWMRGYWKRLDEDCSQPDDDAIYEGLIRYSILESRKAHVAAYLCRGQAVIEFSTRGEAGGGFVSSWSPFDAIACAEELRSFASDMRRAILEARKAGLR